MQMAHMHKPNWVHWHKPDWHAMGTRLSHVVHDPRFWAGLALAILLGAMILAILGTQMALDAALGLDVLKKRDALLFLVASVSTGGGTFLVASFLLRIEELRLVISEILKRIPGRG